MGQQILDAHTQYFNHTCSVLTKIRGNISKDLHAQSKIEYFTRYMTNQNKEKHSHILQNTQL